MQVYRSALGTKVINYCIHGGERGYKAGRLCMQFYFIHCTQRGCSSLHVASDKGNTEVVDTLLKNGADTNQATMVCRRV